MTIWCSQWFIRQINTNQAFWLPIWAPRDLGSGYNDSQSDSWGQRVSKNMCHLGRHSVLTDMLLNRHPKVGDRGVRGTPDKSPQETFDSSCHICKTSWRFYVSWQNYSTRETAPRWTPIRGRKTGSVFRCEVRWGKGRHDHMKFTPFCCEMLHWEFTLFITTLRYSKSYSPYKAKPRR